MRISVIISLMVLTDIMLGISGMSPTYVKMDTDIIFSHNFHVFEMEIECTSCHYEIESSELSSDKNIPTMEECAACHDIEDDESCGVCHKNPEEPLAVENSPREVIFNHQLHLGMELSCDRCHEQVKTSDETAISNLPTMVTCLECHDGQTATIECTACHSSGLTVADIHPIGWKQTHGDRASAEPDYCSQCHKQEQLCISCHRGDNLTGNIHDLNYIFTHALDAKSDETDCARCHDRQKFCVTCHESGLRMPLNHSKLNWRVEHGMVARADVENCSSCHETGDPTCARVGCHNDFDGIIGTNPPIHKDDIGLFDGHGAWHDSDGYYCYQCHQSSRNQPTGFCSYCHQSPGGLK